MRYQRRLAQGQVQQRRTRSWLLRSPVRLSSCVTNRVVFVGQTSHFYTSICSWLLCYLKSYCHSSTGPLLCFPIHHIYPFSWPMRASHSTNPFPERKIVSDWCFLSWNTVKMTANHAKRTPESKRNALRPPQIYMPHMVSPKICETTVLSDLGPLQ